MTKLLMTHPAFCGTTSWVTCLSLRVSFCHTDRISRENLCWKTWDAMSGLENACNEGILTMSGLFLFQEFLGWRWAFRMFTVWMPIVGKKWPRMLCCWSHVNYKNARLNLTESSWLTSYILISISCHCVLVLVWGTSFMMFPLKWNGTQLAFIERPWQCICTHQPFQHLRNIASIDWNLMFKQQVWHSDTSRHLQCSGAVHSAVAVFRLCLPLASVSCIPLHPTGVPQWSLSSRVVVVVWARMILFEKVHFTIALSRRQK